MKVPIPNDWNGTLWQHVCIEWPDSPTWTALLNGLLTYYTRGRAWDERSGDILSAQAIAWDIFFRNKDFNPCESGGQQNDNDGSASQGHGAGGAICPFGEFEMPCIDISHMLKIENGILYALDSCCAWIEVGRIAGINQPLPADPLNPDSDPDFVYAACGKAAAIVNAVYALIVAAMEAVVSIDWPWQMLGNIEDAVGYNLDNTYLAALFVEATAAVGLDIDPTDVFTSIDQQITVCRLVNLFSNDPIGVPDDATYEAIKSVFHSANFIYDGFIMYAIDCYGRGTLDTIAKLGAGDTDANCDCPDVIPAGETTPDINGWYLSANLAGDFTLDWNTGTWRIANVLNTPVHDVYGSFMIVQTLPTQTVKRMDSDTANDGYVPPTHDIDVWGNTSDHIENWNQNYPIISQLTSAIRISLAAQRGFSGNIDGGTTGLNGIVIASPPAAGGNILCASLWSEEPLALGAGVEIIEFRLVHNTNSPSHA